MCQCMSMNIKISMTPPVALSAIAEIWFAVIATATHTHTHTNKHMPFDCAPANTSIHISVDERALQPRWAWLLIQFITASRLNAIQS